MKNLSLLLAFSLIIIGCERIFFEEDLASNDPFENFDYLANELDEKYSYFELKNIDWDKVRNKHRARLSNEMNSLMLFDVMADMMNELRDDHSNLIAPFNVSVYNVALKSKANFNQRTIDEFYIPNPQRTGGFSHDFLRGDSIAYVRYSSFSNSVDKSALDYMLTRYSDTRGLIFDLRANGGGDVFNIPRILERFSEERKLAAYSVTRNGPNHNDFGPREEFVIGSHDGIRYSNPVVVLIDRGSYSASTFFALSTKAFSNITLVGDTTGGGGGLPAGGQLPNGWTYRFSVSQTLDLDGKNYSESGVPPEVRVDFDWSDLSKDEILEEAIALILKP